MPAADSRRRRGARAGGWVGLLGALAGVLLVLLWRRFHYANDDLLQFSVARDDGLSWSTLTLNVFQHFAPYNRMAHYLVFRFTDLSPLAGLAFMTVNYLAMLAAVLWLMTELRLSTVRRVLALGLIGLTVSVCESAVWFDSSMHVLAAIATTMAICAAHVRGVRTGGLRWHVLSLVLFVLGQLTQERPLLALPLAVLLDLLLLWRYLPWAERLRRLWSLRWPLLAMTVLGAVIAAALRAYVVLDDLPVPDVATTLRTMLSALLNYVVPSLVNLPLPEPLSVPAQYLCLGLLVIVGAVLAKVRPGNAGPILFAAGVFCVYYGFLKASPLLNADTIDINAQRLTNAVYVVVPAIVGLVHLTLPGPGLRLPVRWRRTGLATVALALAAYLAVTDTVYLDRQWAGTTDARAYLDAVRAGAAQWSDPDVSLVPLTAPSAMGMGWSAPFLKHDNLLNLISKDFERGDFAGRPVLIDDRGHVRPAALVTSEADVEIIGGGCGADPDPRGSEDALLSVTPAVRGAPLFLMVEYRADRDMEVQLGTHGRQGWELNRGATRVDGGGHRQLLPLDASFLDAVDIRPRNRGGICVQRADLVRAVLNESNGVCREVDRRGRPGAIVVCP